MASAFSHAIVALAMGKAFQNKELSWRELFLGALCAVVPDLDVIGFYFGIQYGDVWGHRGLTHSVVFAALLAGSLVALWYRGKPAAAMTGLFLYFAICTASHGVLDAMTNGGLGVAFSLHLIRRDISSPCGRYLCLQSASANFSAHTVFGSWPAKLYGFGCHPVRHSWYFAQSSGFGQPSQWHLLPATARSRSSDCPCHS